MGYPWTRWVARVTAPSLLLLLLLSGGRAKASCVVTPLDLPCLASVQSQTVSPIGNQVIPIGRAVGIKMFSDGVLVVGLSSIDTPGRSVSPGRACGLKAGDVVTHINQTEVNTIEEVQAILAREKDNPLTLQVQRGGKSLQLTTQAACSTMGAYQLGVWLRDSMAGIGTMTFYDPKSGVFAALGHGINDVDTAKLMPLEAGSIMHASVSDVKKGMSGEPGELHGVFDLTHDLGSLYANTDQGIFGHMQPSDLVQGLTPVEVARRNQVQEGKAVIRSNIAGDQVEEYEIEIVHIYPEREEKNRNMMLRVTDPRLLESTGGIVQGMSGSPILQDGKLVGAVTHVLVNDPTTGYGIFIKNMPDAAAYWR